MYVMYRTRCEKHESHTRLSTEMYATEIEVEEH